ncbi:MAG: 4Fe-4S dicluster domain-containing protein [Ignavibacteria bacterium]|nr:4Fe-4S dicluster domain-containing protein [Ignavibacteria bacterium]
MNNIYMPHTAEIKEIIDESPDTRTFRLRFRDADRADRFEFKAGQFAEYSAFGDGETTFCIASSPKFRYYVNKFGEILCTGCGRCSRGCPVSIDIKEIVSNCKNDQKELK